MLNKREIDTAVTKLHSWLFANAVAGRLTPKASKSPVAQAVNVYQIMLEKGVPLLSSVYNSKNAIVRLFKRDTKNLLIISSKSFKIEYYLRDKA